MREVDIRYISDEMPEVGAEIEVDGRPCVVDDVTPTADGGQAILVFTDDLEPRTGVLGE